MPYPKLNNSLAREDHMYIHKNGELKKRELLKIQSIKNDHLINGFPVETYYPLFPGDNDNPCDHDSFVDLEKLFYLEQVFIPAHKKARGPITLNTFNSLCDQLKISNYIDIDIHDFLVLNEDCDIIFND